MRSWATSGLLGSLLFSITVFILASSSLSSLGAEDRKVPTVTAGIATPTVTATAVPVPLPEPSALTQMTLDGQPLASGGWAVGGIALGVRAFGSARLVSEVELSRTDAPDQAPTVHRVVPVELRDSAIESQVWLRDLEPGAYRWRARFADIDGGRTGQWRSFASGDLGFRLLRRPPVVRGLIAKGAAQASDELVWIGERGLASLSWTVETEVEDAIDRIVVMSEHVGSGESVQTGEPNWTRVLPANSRGLDIEDMLPGRWRLSVWAVDKAGQIGETASIRVAVLRDPPKATVLAYRTVATNPLYTSVRLRFAVSHSARTTVSFAANGESAPVRSYSIGRVEPGREVVVEWDGRNERGEVVPTGGYRFAVDLVDDAGNRSQAWQDGLTITDKLIRVSLATQSLVASAGARAFVSTLVTTGGRELPTRPGRFEVELKGSPFTFRAPFATNSRYWYPPTTVRYAILFDPDEGNFLHDKSSRTVFGPGTNGAGVPGGPYSGSHGCVNVPNGAMAALYDWAPLGTPVIVEP